VRSLAAISRRQCRQIVEERFSRERMVDDYISVYHKIIGKKN
jgi:glycosyltransferase involved in cell wall biosynthesis